MAKQITKEEDDLTKKRMEELAPLAKKVIDLISTSNVKIGDLHAHDYKAYDAVAKEILALLLENKVKYVDKEFVKQLVLQPFDQAMGIAITSLQRSFDLTLDKVLGKEFGQLTLQDLDEKMKE